MEKELFEIYQRNFPLIVRDENTVRRILSNENNRIIEERDAQHNLIGAAVINKDALLLFCVDEKYRNRGIGSRLLESAEQLVKDCGYDRLVVGAGFDYITPGVPTSKRWFDSENEALTPGLDETASDFFTKRGYIHAWECNCFDMKCLLTHFAEGSPQAGDVVEGITYRWAVLDDLEQVCACTDDAYSEFTEYYRQEGLYHADSPARVLIAVLGEEVVGTLIVTAGDGRQKLGSVGCTTVRPAFRGRHIAVNLVIAANGYLKKKGMEEVYLSYTYSGLDHMYGYAGYQICIYYMMAEKIL